jgi:hypothetical protein
MMQLCPPSSPGVGSVLRRDSGGARGRPPDPRAPDRDMMRPIVIMPAELMPFMA